VARERVAYRRRRGRAQPLALTSAALALVTVLVVATDGDGGVRRAETGPSERAADRLRAGIDSVDAAWARLGDRLTARDTAGARGAFRDARRHYKTHEALLESLAPSAAAALNGRRQEIDDDEAPPPGLTASAFAEAEGALFGGATDWTAAAAAARRARTTLALLRRQAPAFRVSPPIAFDAARLEVARVVTLGLTGFDTPDTRDGVRESADALRGVASLVGEWAGTDSAVARLRAAAAYLDAHAVFDTLDRLAFVVGWSEPALRALDDARRRARVERLAAPRFWVGATLFERGAFDPSALAPAYAPRATPPLVALGARLFADPALSGPGTRACASCHRPAGAFADGRRAAASLGGAAHLRNTPSLLAAAYEPALFADARAVTLEDQAGAVLASPAEMGGSAERAAARVSASAEYRAAFAAAFGSEDVTATRLRVALAAYVRSLGRLESRVDAAFRGDTLALDATERRGASLFLGKAGCGTCHFAPLFAGATPPLFRSIDAEVLGVPTARVPTAGAPTTLDADPGRGAVDGRPEHAHAFKTPTVRNVALTAPYMHDGALRTLSDVVAFYDRGGGRGAGLDVPNQTLPPRALHLTRDERAALVAFMRALTDTGLAPGAARH
jgi:cytochrome c peroxidase